MNISYWGETVETDYSPLEQIFEKNQSLTLSRFQWFIIKYLIFDIQVKYKLRKTIPVANALSRVCFTENRKGTPQQHNINFIMANMKIINIERVKEALIADPTMNPVEGHNIHRMAIIQKTIPDNTFGILDLQVQPHPRRWINPQGGQNCCPRSTETLSL